MMNKNNDDDMILHARVTPQMPHDLADRIIAAAQCEQKQGAPHNHTHNHNDTDGHNIYGYIIIPRHIMAVMMVVMLVCGVLIGGYFSPVVDEYETALNAYYTVPFDLNTEEIIL